MPYGNKRFWDYYVIKNPNVKYECIFLIDRTDLHFVENKLVCFDKNGYLKIRHNGKLKLLHRLIMGEPENINIDHINRDTTDCRKRNLRMDINKCNSQNVMASKNSKSGYKGVWWYGPLSKWQAQITYKDRDGVSRNHHIGYFYTKEEAANEYNKVAIKHHEFACLNIIN